MSFDERLAGLHHVATARARQAAAGEVVPLVEGDRGSAGAFAQFVAFHRRPTASVAATTAGSAAAPNNDIDFHRAVTALGEYSWLLRRLGLIFDLEIDAARLPASAIGALRRLRAQPRFSAPLTDASAYTPFTNTFSTMTRMAPCRSRCFSLRRGAPTPADVRKQDQIVAGFLNLGRQWQPPPPTDDLQFDVFNIDIDGAAK